MEPPTIVRNKRWKTQRFLSHWGVWMAIAYLALVAITVTGFVSYGRTVKQAAVNKAQVERCVATRPTLAQINHGFGGLKDVSRILVVNNATIVSLTPRDDPQFNARLANLRRLIFAREQVAALPDFPVPTVAQCRQSGH